jgi:hypothetical protein
MEGAMALLRDGVEGREVPAPPPAAWAEPERFAAARGAALAGDLAAGWAALEREAAGRAEAAALAGVAFAAGAAGKALGADAATDGTELADRVPADGLAAAAELAAGAGLAAAEALEVERWVGVAMTQLELGLGNDQESGAGNAQLS